MMTLRESTVIGVQILFLTIAASCELSFASQGSSDEYGNESYGYVLEYLHEAIYQNDDESECPQGFQHSQDENFNAQFPSPKEREQVLKRYGYYTHRGPSGQNVFYHPEVIEDPLPFKTLDSKVGLGLDLDNRIDSEDFRSPDGHSGIDNQLYRVVGCIAGFRKGGMIEGLTSSELIASTKGRLVVEITGVNSIENDDDVAVHLYRGSSKVNVSPSNEIVPFGTQIIDHRFGKRFEIELKGHIQNGVLTTNAKTIEIPIYRQTQMPSVIQLFRAQFRLDLTHERAEGVVGGYLIVDDWYYDTAKSWGAHKFADTIGWSGPSLYSALKKSADLKPDEESESGYISAAYSVKLSRVYIID